MAVVIFGGSGFIGKHYAEALLEHNPDEILILADLNPPQVLSSQRRLKAGLDEGRVLFQVVDVRKAVEISLNEPVRLIANFAAIHREPGHECEEYFATNLLGAENVTAYAEAVGCEQLIFTSSISVYGWSETFKDESALPQPRTPYGSSKLAAEKIHLTWLARDEQKRKLVIVRPGVVYGPGEGGNVSRMVRAIGAGYFFYCGNRQLKKAGGYVKELVSTFAWSLETLQDSSEPLLLYNFSADPIPTLEDFATAIGKRNGRFSLVPTVPYGLLLAVAVVLSALARLIDVRNTFDPVRIRKLKRSNAILPGRLRECGYESVYSLQSGLDDWMADAPAEWGSARKSGTITQKVKYSP